MTGRRISSAGITPGPATLTFTYEGETIPARAGESVGAALVAAGQLAMRQTRSGKDRGPFCGMGACHECRAFGEAPSPQVQHARACAFACRECTA
jgi:hypothetical protein